MRIIRKRTGEVPVPTIGRLPWYLAYVSELEEEGVEHVSSTQIARRTNVSSPQIAKDLSFLGLPGRTRIGYEVKALAEGLRRFLGFGVSHRAILAGVGSLGSALLADDGLQRFGLRIVGAVDINPAIAGTRRGAVTVSPSDELESLVQATQAEIGIITVPVECAQQVAEDMARAGLRALWNFAPCRIALDGDTVVQDTSIYAHLALMYNRLSKLKDELPPLISPYQRP